MEITTINIAKAPTYGPDKGKYIAKIALNGGSIWPADINIAIPPELLEPIVRIIEQTVVEAMTQSAKEFREAVAASLSPPIEHKALEAKVEEAAPTDTDTDPDGDIPF